MRRNCYRKYHSISILLASILFSTPLILADSNTQSLSTFVDTTRSASIFPRRTSDLLFGAEQQAIEATDATAIASGSATNDVSNEAPQSQENQQQQVDTTSDSTSLLPPSDFSDPLPLWETYQVVWILLAIVVGLMIATTIVFLSMMDMIYERQDNETKTWNLLQYLPGFQETSVRRSPLGGFNVTYNERDVQNLAAGERQDAVHKAVPYSSTPSPTRANLKLSMTSRTSSSQESDDGGSGGSTASRAVFWYFLFLCISNGLRAVESGFVGSMMPEIQADLELDYADEGIVAASPDCGLSPGAILAIFTFRCFSSKRIMEGVFFFSALFWVLLAMFPSFPMLVFCRAINGALWSHAATYFPVWIDRNGPCKKSRTLWMSWVNISLLLGVFVGYVVGGASRSTGLSITWIDFYYGQAIVNGVLGAILIFCFDRNLVKMDKPYRDKQHSAIYEDEEHTSMHAHGVLGLLGSLLQSVPYVLSVLINSAIAGGVVFALYFMAQIGDSLGEETETFLIMTLIVFAVGPAPGMFVGSWIVGRLGGYTDHIVSFGMALASSFFVLGSTILFPVAQLVGSKQLYVFAQWSFFFTGAMPGAPLHGVSVSCLPKASHVASSVQFAIANAGKIAVPQIGGYVCQQMGLLEGYNATLIVTSIVLMTLSFIGLLHAIRYAPQQTLDASEDSSDSQMR